MRLLVPALLLLASLAGCVSEDVPDDDPIAPSQPIVNEPYNGTLSGFGEASIFEMPGGGQGIWVHENILYWTNGADLWIADVTDPAHPVMLGNVTEVGARDVDIIEWQGRTYAALAGSGRGMHLVDVTDPAMPEFVTTVDMPSAGVHNLAVVPGTPYIYSSGASGVPGATGAAPDRDGKIDVLDITDPQNPVVSTFLIPPVVGETVVESDGCHDISVRSDLGLAFCAGGGGRYFGSGGETFIWDISEDPRDPVWLSAIDDPRIKYHHQAFANTAGDVLILDDEYVGPLVAGGANNCFDANVPMVDDEDQIPLAAAWLYDISDPSAPELLAFVQNPSGWDGDGVPPNPAEGNCGSHFGDLIQGQEAFVMGWYEGGTLMVDFSNPADPVVVDVQPADQSHWDSRYWKGHIYHAGADLVVTPLI